MSENCYVCNSKQIVRVTLETCYNNRERNVVICQSCGHCRICDKIDQKENVIAQGNHFDESLKMPYVRCYNREKVILRQLNRFCKKGKILDIGCNNGKWLMVVGDKWDRFGIEVSTKAAEVAKRCGAKIFNGPFEDYALRNDFDVITAFNIIEHLEDPRTITEWAYNHLKPGGFFVVLTPDRESVAAKKFGEKWPMYFPLVHLHFFTARSLDFLIEEAGFVIKKHEWYYGFYKAFEKKVWPRLLYWKAKELLHIADKPLYDHLYLYAQKPKF